MILLPLLAVLVLLWAAFVLYVGPPGSKQRRITTRPLFVVVIKCHTARFVAAMNEVARQLGEQLRPAVKRAGEAFAECERAFAKAHEKNRREPW